jgi:hypothetical protein
MSNPEHLALARSGAPNADLWGAILVGATLTDADLTGATLTDADLWGAILVGATLTGATLTGATLTGATLTGATLTGADLAGVRIEEAFLPSDLRIMQVHVGGPRHRTTTLWRLSDGPVRLRQGCIDVEEDTSEALYDLWVEWFDAARDDDWTDAQLAAAHRRVRFAIEEIFADE